MAGDWRDFVFYVCPERAIWIRVDNLLQHLSCSVVDIIVDSCIIYIYIHLILTNKNVLM